MTISWETLVAALAAKGEIRIHLDLASILGYILVGLIVGLVARLIVPGRDPLGLLGTLLVGVIGAASVGGWPARCSRRPRAWTGSPPSWSLPCSSYSCARAPTAA